MHERRPVAPVTRSRAQGQNFRSDAARKEAQAAFIEAYARIGIEIAACREVKVDPSTIIYWRTHDEDFAEAHALAAEEGDMLLEEELHRRAVTGWEEPVFHKGQATGAYIRRFSDRLLEIILRRRMPDLYRDNARIEMAGQITGKVDVHVKYDELPIPDFSTPGLLNQGKEDDDDGDE